MLILISLLVAAAITSALAILILAVLRWISLTRQIRAERDRYTPTPPTITLG